MDVNVYLSTLKHAANILYHTHTHTKTHRDTDIKTLTHTQTHTESYSLVSKIV